MAQRRFTVQTLPGGEVLQPLTRHEVITCVMEHTGQSETTVSYGVVQLSQFVPRVTIPGVTLDKRDVRVAIA